MGARRRVNLARWLVPPTARRLLRNAGPPPSWDLAAIVAGSLLFGVAAVANGAVRWLVIGAALVVFVVPAALDRTGWRVRVGMAQLAVEQRRRMSAANLPRTPAGADRWLTRPATEATDLIRASVLLTAGRTAEARAVVEAYHPQTDEDRVRVIRMLAGIDGLVDGGVDTAAADAAIDRLPAELQRYHRLSLAWSVAWVAAANGRPWRERFADAATGLDWDGVPLRYRAWHATQELLVLVVGVIFLVTLVMVGVLR